MPSLLTTWFGTFLIDADKVVDKRLVTQDAEVIAKRLGRIRADEVLPEEIELAADREGLKVHERRLSKLGLADPVARVPTVPFDPAASGYPSRLLHDALLRLAVQEAHLAFSDRDMLIVQQVRALDEIVRTANQLAERLREWYAVHAPEVVGRVRDHADLARLIAEETDREAVAAKVGDLILSDLGVAPPKPDEEIVRTFAGGLARLYETWNHIESRLADVMKEVAPNLARVAGPMLGARLIAAAGGLQRLAMLPSGTVQTLGAENALFRHLKDGSPPPKHGIIYQYEAVNRGPWWQRGKIARALSGKILIAAKADAFGTDPTRGETLANEMDERLAEIQRQYPHPPRRGPGGPRGPPRRMQRREA